MLTNLLDQMGHLRLRRALPLLLVAVFIVGLLAAPALVNTSRAQPGVVSIDPPSLEVPVGASGTVDVRSDGLTNIYGAQFTVNFDTTYLQVVDADGNAGNGVQITPGTCPVPNFVATNSADNAAGTVGYAATQLAPTAPCDGGVIATIEFQCRDTPSVDPVTVPVTIVESIVSNPDGEPLEHTVQNGQIICRPGCPVSGQVQPQGYAEAVEVCLDGTHCVTLAPDFSFSFVVPEGAHSVTANSLHHLASEVDFTCDGAAIELGTTKLRAGDLDDNGVINILDLVMVGGNFLKEEPQPWVP